MTFSAAVLFNYDGPLKNKSCVTFFMNNVEGRWLGNIYKQFSFKFLNVSVEISFVNIAEHF